MSVFDLDQGADAERLDVRENGVGVDDIQPGFFEGTLKGTGLGIARGAAKLGRAGALAVGGGLSLAEKIGGYDPGSVTDSYFDMVVKPTDEAVEFYQPRANTVGTAGRVLGGLAEIVAPLALTAGNPAALVGSTGLNTSYELAKQGVDPTTAVSTGLVDATAAGLGFKLPFLGPTLATKIASGAGGNLLLGAGSTAADRAILEAGGYDEIAKQYNPLDVEARTVDLLTGAAFGGLAQLQGGSSGVPRGARDAALTGLNAKHAQLDTAPGRPLDDAASAAHQRALESALISLQTERPLDTGPSGVTDANFEPRPTPAPAESAPAVSAALDELGIKSEPIDEALRSIPRDVSLRAADKAIESALIEKINRDPDAAIAEYAALPETEGGKVLNTDIARELSPEYLADRTKSAAVHEPASALVKAMYARKLKEQPGPGEQPVVVFSAGGTGAGKSSGLDLTGVGKQAQIVYDSNMNSLASAVKRIEQALAAGKLVQILYTYRDPVDALTAGALPRAMKQKAKHGSGRTVPIGEHANTHSGASKVIRQIAEKYADDPRVNVSVVDNSRGRGNAKVSSLDVVPEVKSGDNSLQERLNDALDKEYAEGRISEDIYRGFKGDVRPEAVREPVREGSREPVEQPAGERAGKPEADPDVIAAERSLEEGDVQIPTGELDADGIPKTTSAREALSAAREEVAKAERESTAFEAAVACALSFGEAA